VKLKGLVVIALFVLGCSFASAQTFGFASTGSGLNCNYEKLNVASWFSPDIIQGEDVLSACGASVNATIAGLKSVSIPTTAGLPVSGDGAIYADNIYDAFAEGYTGVQWILFTALKCNKINPKTGKFTGKYSWLGIASASGLVYGDNYGYLSCGVPDVDREVKTPLESTVGAVTLLRKK
jgi:hypothetical protein